jgi:hypothetical protein
MNGQSSSSGVCRGWCVIIGTKNTFKEITPQRYALTYEICVSLASCISLGTTYRALVFFQIIVVGGLPKWEKKRPLCAPFACPRPYLPSPALQQAHSVMISPQKPSGVAQASPTRRNAPLLLHHSPPRVLRSPPPPPPHALPNDHQHPQQQQQQQQSWLRRQQQQQQHQHTKAPAPEEYLGPPRVAPADDAPPLLDQIAALAPAPPPKGGRPGRIEVIMGPMFAGKTTALLDRVRARFDRVWGFWLGGGLGGEWQG